MSTTNGHGYRILQFSSENFKRLKAVNIHPDKNTVVISGENEQGKSSILDAIIVALAGKDALKNVPQPIRAGEKKAEIKVDLGEFIITRSFTEKDTYLKVSTPAGANFGTPQAVLDKLFNKSTIDPSAFLSMDDEKQFKLLRSIVKIDVNIDELEEERLAKFNERTIVNREVRTLQSQFEGLELPEEGLPDEEQSAQDIIDKITLANEVIDANNEKRRELKDLGDDYKNKKEKIADLNVEINALREALRQKEEKLAEVEKELAQVQSEGKALKAEVEELKDPDVTIFNTELENLEKINRKIRSKKEYFEKKEALTLKKQEAETLTRDIEELVSAKEMALASAEFPVKGLGFGENGITFKGIPFSQASQEEKIRVSMAIAMAQNPKLKVILIRDGSLFDKKNLALIQEIAKEKDYQVWIEKVGEDPEVGIIIEDGSVKNGNGKAAETKPEVVSEEKPKTAARRSKKAEPVENMFE